VQRRNALCRPDNTRQSPTQPDTILREVAHLPSPTHARNPTISDKTRQIFTNHNIPDEPWSLQPVRRSFVLFMSGQPRIVVLAYVIALAVPLASGSKQRDDGWRTKRRRRLSPSSIVLASESCLPNYIYCALGKCAILCCALRLSLPAALNSVPFWIKNEPNDARRCLLLISGPKITG
jgi:hypothetical protein